MPRLSINGMQVEVPKGATILEAARKLDIEIPTMCFLEGFEPATSCMLCVVEVRGREHLVPACATVAGEGIQVRTDSEEILEARKTALELLLSDHLGDCMGPCSRGCPAQMDIPLMIRQIARNQLREAIITVKKDIAFPAVLGRICPAPCQKACRRGFIDDPVAVCLLKRFVADADLRSQDRYIPRRLFRSDKRVAVVGAGPAGLAAAYHLLLLGYRCTVFDKDPKPGGKLRTAVGWDKLPPDVLDGEIAVIEKLGLEFKGGVEIGRAVSIEDLGRDFDAVFIAAGEIRDGDAAWSGLEMDSLGIAVKAGTYQTSLEGVFAGGDAVRKRRLAVRSVADGKEASVSIDQYLRGAAVTGPGKPFNTRIGRLRETEAEEFLKNASGRPSTGPSGKEGGFTDSEAQGESLRCLHCDCRKPVTCKLRRYAALYGAGPGRFKDNRRRFEQNIDHGLVIYEPGKCIDCGLCIQITEKALEPLGLAFAGRGFNVRVAVPFGRSLEEALKTTAQKCAEVCPTGALALK